MKGNGKSHLLGNWCQSPNGFVIRNHKSVFVTRGRQTEKKKQIYIQTETIRMRN